MVLCSICTASILVTQKRIRCSSTNCPNHYHQECVKYNESTSISRSKSVCPECDKHYLITENSNLKHICFVITKKKSPIASNKSPDVCTTNSIQDKILDEIRGLRNEMNDKFKEQQSCLSKFDSTLSNIRKDIQELGTKFTEMRTELDEVVKTVSFLSEIHDDQVNINKENSKLISNFVTENSTLQTKLGEITAALEGIEQRARDSNMEIQCVPESKSENLFTHIKQLANTVSYQLSEKDVLNCHRVAKYNPGNKRPRSIIIKMISPRVRDNFLAAIKLYNFKNKDNKLISTHLGFTTNRPIYAMEHLSPKNKQLHAATRIVAKEKKYEFVWIRNGKIFVRKNIKSEAKIVRDKDFLEKL
nr:uncharacterized protein LOC113396764 [Vanessa tameamea]